RANALARVDPLTGLGNRRAFEESMATEIARSRRHESPLSLLICDLDQFKKINDAYGHLAGDNCLRQVADALRNELRGADVCFRWGGDEFVVVLPAPKRLLRWGCSRESSRSWPARARAPTRRRCA